MDACILPKKIPQHYKIKQEDKHFFPHLLKCISIYKRKLLISNPPSICNAGNLLSHMIKNITFQASVINEQVAE